MPQVGCDRWVVVLRVLAMTMAMGAASARPALACSCVPTPCSAAAGYDAVFEATVDALVQPPPSPDGIESSAAPIQVRFRDLRAIRGEAEPLVITARSSASCGFPFKVGTRYLVFATRRSLDGRLGVGLCGLTRPVEGNAGLVRYVESLSTQSGGGRVFGRVVVPDLPTRNEYRLNPVEGVRISLVGQLSADVDTDSSGAFEFIDLPPGDYSVSARMPDSRSDLSLAPTSVTVNDAHACADLTLVPRLASGVTGIVVDDEGRPMSGVFLMLRPVVAPGEAAGGFGYTTGADGVYRFENVPPGVYRTGVSLDRGPVPASPFAPTPARTQEGSTEIEVRAGARVRLEPLRLRRLSPLRIVGRVVTVNGTPVAGLLINASSVGLDGRLQPGSNARTDADGRFVVSGYSTMTHRLVVGDEWRRPEAVVEVTDPTVPQAIVLSNR